jgi:hypothetical protein
VQARRHLSLRPASYSTRERTSKISSDEESRAPVFSACLGVQLFVETMQQEWWTRIHRNVRCEDAARPQRQKKSVAFCQATSRDQSCTRQTFSRAHGSRPVCRASRPLTSTWRLIIQPGSVGVVRVRVREAAPLGAETNAAAARVRTSPGRTPRREYAARAPWQNQVTRQAPASLCT